MKLQRWPIWASMYNLLFIQVSGDTEEQGRSHESPISRNRYDISCTQLLEEQCRHKTWVWTQLNSTVQSNFYCTAQHYWFSFPTGLNSQHFNNLSSCLSNIVVNAAAIQQHLKETPDLFNWVAVVRRFPSLLLFLI